MEVVVEHIEDGLVKDLDLNDKCAASCGRYIENMANILEVPVNFLSQYNQNPINLNSTCAVFSESELIGKIAEGIPLEILCASINYSLYRKLKPMLTRFSKEKLIISGGVAYNKSFCSFFEKEYEEIIKISEPQFNGAIGCCYYASKMLANNFENKGV